MKSKSLSGVGMFSLASTKAKVVIAPSASSICREWIVPLHRLTRVTCADTLGQASWDPAREKRIVFTGASAQAVQLLGELRMAQQEAQGGA